MLFVIHALDHEGGVPKRVQNYRDHRRHLDAASSEGLEILSAGPLVAEDGETPIGSLIVVDAPDRAAVDAFCRTDPYQANGVWASVQVNAYVKRRGWATKGTEGI